MARGNKHYPVALIIQVSLAEAQQIQYGQGRGKSITEIRWHKVPYLTNGLTHLVLTCFHYIGYPTDRYDSNSQVGTKVNFQGLPVTLPFTIRLGDTSIKL